DEGVLSGFRQPRYFRMPPCSCRVLRLKYKLSYPAGGDAVSIADKATFVIVGKGESSLVGALKKSNRPRSCALRINSWGTPSRQSNKRRARSICGFPWICTTDPQPGSNQF